jgi:hypothetical protein
MSDRRQFSASRPDVVYETGLCSFIEYRDYSIVN